MQILTVLAQQTQRHTDRHTLIHNKLIMYLHALLKKGNFLLFGIVIVFQIADLMFG